MHFLFFLFVSIASGRTNCSDLGALELTAAQGPLTEEIENCLLLEMRSMNPTDRAHASFVLILSAHSGDDEALYLERMRAHLGSIHSEDPEVAYLLAWSLYEQSGGRADPPFAPEIFRWSKVAMNGRSRWLANRRNYNEMVRRLYDMLVQSTLTLGARDQKQYELDPSPENLQTWQLSKRRARFYLIEAAPCLHHNECGPRFEAIVEDMAECADLRAMGNYARSGRLSTGQQACLRSSYRQLGAPKRRVLDILITDAENRPSDDAFRFLLAWVYSSSGADDPELAYRYVRWLVDQHATSQEVLDWVGPALVEAKGERRRQLLTWQLLALKELRIAARSQHKVTGTVRASRALSSIERQFENARRELDIWCESHRKGCPGQ